MDEEQWLSGESVRAMIHYLRDEQRAARTKAGRRKLRLFAAACFREAWAELPEVARRFVEGLEHEADGAAHAGGAAALYAQVIRGWVPLGADSQAARLLAFGLRQADPSATPSQAAERVSHFVTLALASQGQPEGAARRRHAELLREVFGNPFRPPPKRKFPADLRGLPQACYDDHAPYPLLADALDDLGEAEMAAHCRQTGHVKGCHVVDRVLGKG